METYVIWDNGQTKFYESHSEHSTYFTHDIDSACQFSSCEEAREVMDERAIYGVILRWM